MFHVIKVQNFLTDFYISYGLLGLCFQLGLQIWVEHCHLLFLKVCICLLLLFLFYVYIFTIQPFFIS
jgi:hypothetical protein